MGLQLSEQELQVVKQLLLMCLGHYHQRGLQLEQVSKTVMVQWIQSLVHLQHQQKFLTEWLQQYQLTEKH